MVSSSHTVLQWIEYGGHYFIQGHIDYTMGLTLQAILECSWTKA